MELLEILSLIHNTYGLAVTLKDYLLSRLGSRDNERELTGLISLAETIELNLCKIKVELESSITIQK